MGKMKEVSIVKINEDGDIKESFARMGRAFGMLDESEQRVLRLRYGFEDSKLRTLEEVGKIKSVTRERVRQIESRAFDKLNLILNYEKRKNN